MIGLNTKIDNKNFYDENNNEIRELEFKSKKDIKIDNNNWLNNLNIILKNVNPFNISPRNHKTKIDFTKEEEIESTISINDVYGSKKIHSELPIGSFSRKNGIFIPIPSYLDENMDIVESHWIFVKGNWVGDKWVQNWVPKLPSFIKNFFILSFLAFESIIVTSSSISKSYSLIHIEVFHHFYNTPIRF